MNPVSSTPEVFGSIITAVNGLAGMNLTQIAMLFAGVLVGIVGLCGGVQHILELVYSWFPNIPFWVKPFLPKVFASVIGAIAKFSGMDAATSASIAGTLMLTIEGIHNSPLALDLSAKTQAAKAAIDAATAKSPFTSMGAGLKSILIGLMTLAAVSAHAEITLSQNFGTGSTLYAVGQGGEIVSTGGAAATYGLNFSYVGTTATATGTASQDNYVVLSTGPAGETLEGRQYLGWYLEIGTQIPATPANLMIGTIGTFFTGAANPFGICASVNFPIGQLWYTWR